MLPELNKMSSLNSADVIIEDAERSSSSSSSEEEFVVSRGRVFTGTEARIRAASIGKDFFFYLSLEVG